MRLTVLGILVVAGAVALASCGATTTDTPAAASTGGVSSGGGGMSADGAAGSAGSGGVLGGGGAGSGGTADSAGSAGDAGSAGASSSSRPTAGCGKAPDQPLGEWQQYFVPISGETLGQPHYLREREIFVRLPANYDSLTAYRVVYIAAGCTAPDGASAAYPLFDEAQGGDPNAIYVALSLPDLLVDNVCYEIRSGLDSIEWESFDHDHAFVSDRFCVDDSKVYMGGYSSGAWLANMYSCYFGGIPEPPRKFLPGVALRGAMAVAGCWLDGNPPCNGPVGGLFIHDQDDPTLNTLACAHGQRDRLLAQNGCTGGSAGPTEPWGSDIIVDGTCLKYTACPAEYPVVFCTTTGRAHGSQNDNAIPGFTRFVQELDEAAP